MSANSIAIFLIATAVYYALGLLWFSEWCLAPMWRRECGLAKEIMDRTPKKIVTRNYIASFFICALAVSATMTLRRHLIDLNFLEWMRVVLVLNGAWVCCTSLRGYLYQKRSLHLFLIEAGYHYVGLMIVAAIVGNLAV